VARARASSLGRRRFRRGLTLCCIAARDPGAPSATTPTARLACSGARSGEPRLHTPRSENTEAANSGCVNSISAFSPRGSSKSEDTVCPGGHAGVSSGLTVEVRTDREWGTARASSVSVRLHVGKHVSGEIARTAAALSRPRGSARQQGWWLPRGYGSRTLQLSWSENQGVTSFVRAARPDPTPKCEQFWCASAAELTQARALGRRERLTQARSRAHRSCGCGRREPARAGSGFLALRLVFPEAKPLRRGALARQCVEKGLS
jgi:hypothetical protein